MVFLSLESSRRPCASELAKENQDQIPTRFHPNIVISFDWRLNDYLKTRQDRWLKGIFDMAGAGKRVFAGVDPDEYVRQLRQDWD
jgi:hypothetical protein